MGRRPSGHERLGSILARLLNVSSSRHSFRVSLLRLAGQSGQHSGAEQHASSCLLWISRCWQSWYTDSPCWLCSIADNVNQSINQSIGDSMKTEEVKYVYDHSGPLLVPKAKNGVVYQDTTCPGVEAAVLKGNRNRWPHLFSRMPLALSCLAITACVAVIIVSIAIRQQ